MPGLFGTVSQFGARLITPELWSPASFATVPGMVGRLEATFERGWFGRRVLTSPAPRASGAFVGSTIVLADGPVWSAEGTLLDRSALEQRYDRSGLAGFFDLQGEFVIAVWDPVKAECALVNDRFGLLPTYWTTTTAGLFFGPTIKPLLSAPALRPVIDRTAVSQYIRFQQLLGRRTWFEGVSILRPGSVLIWNARTGDVREDRYRSWSALHEAPAAIRLDDAVDGIVERFVRSVKRAATCPRPGVFLSGGLDSRSILGALDGIPDVATLSYGIEGCRDVVYGREIARLAGRPHMHVPFPDGNWLIDAIPDHLALTEGQHSWIHAHGLSAVAPARAVMETVLNGWAGGTLFATGRTDGRFDRDRPYRSAVSEVHLSETMFDGFAQRFAWPGLTEAEARSLVRQTPLADANDRARASFDEELALTRNYPPAYRVDFFYLEQHDVRSIGQSLAFLRSGLDVRCPFADPELFAFLYALPPAVKWHPMLRRLVITRLAPKLARVPRDRDDRPPHASRAVQAWYTVRQRSRRLARRIAPARFPDLPTLYADYERYLRSDLKPWAESLVFDRRTLDRGLFREDALRTLWTRHVGGQELHTIGKIAPLMTIEMVMRYLVDGQTAEEASRLEAGRRAQVGRLTAPASGLPPDRL